MHFGPRPNVRQMLPCRSAAVVSKPEERTDIVQVTRLSSFQVLIESCCRFVPF